MDSTDQLLPSSAAETYSEEEMNGGEERVYRCHVWTVDR